MCTLHSPPPLLIPLPLVSLPFRPCIIDGMMSFISSPMWRRLRSRLMRRQQGGGRAGTIIQAAHSLHHHTIDRHPRTRPQSCCLAHRTPHPIPITHASLRRHHTSRKHRHHHHHPPYQQQHQQKRYDHSRSLTPPHRRHPPHHLHHLSHSFLSTCV